jgi:RNA polymerase sigma-70 factor (ECF subfamily)
MQLANLTMMDYNEADKMFDAEELEIMIRTLPPTSQKVFNLYVIDGYNHKEIGEQLNISEGTSKWHLSSARAKLKELMRKILNNVAAV